MNRLFGDPSMNVAEKVLAEARNLLFAAHQSARMLSMHINDLVASSFFVS
jgi:hypothetical protein